MNTILVLSMYKWHKRSLTSFIVCFFLINTLFSESYHTISNNLFKYFSEKNNTVTKQYLKNSQSDQFPFNIIIPSEKEKDGKQIYFLISEKSNLASSDIVLSLTKSGTVVLCANNGSSIPSSMQNETFTGLRTFLSSVSEDAAIIILSENSSLDSHEMHVIPGGNGYIASSGLLQPLLHAGQISGIDISIQSLLLSFYRLNWVDGSEAVSFCLEHGYQAVELVISDRLTPEDAENYVKALSDSFLESEVTDDTQYSLINTGTNIISISEKLYTVILFSILAITLLISCLFSFMFGKRKLENRVIFIRYWYAGPLLVIICFFLTWLSQYTVTSLSPSYKVHPFAALTLKTSFSILFFLLFCEIRYLIKLAETDYLYAFFMTLSAALDVFLFTSVDMPLLLPFTIFYIVILCSRPVKKWWINLIILILMSIPPVYVLLQSGPWLREDIVISFTSSSLILDFFLSLLLLPYLLMIVRILIGSGIWNRNKGLKRILIELAILSALLAAAFIITVNLDKEYTAVEITEDGQSVQPAESDGTLVTVNAGGTISNGMLYFNLQLSSEENILRYDISVTSEAAVPLYSAELPFTFGNAPGNAVFTLDENPCNPFSVTATASSSLPFEINISALIQVNKEFVLEKHTVSFTEKNSGRLNQPEIIIR